MNDEINDFVRHCENCQRGKYGNKSVRKMIPLGVPTGKWKSVTMDFADMPEKSGFLILLTVVDRFSKMVKLIALRKGKTKANNVIGAMITEVFSNFGVSDEIISDRNPRLVSEEWENYCIKHGI